MIIIKIFNSEFYSNEKYLQEKNLLKCIYFFLKRITLSKSFQWIYIFILLPTRWPVSNDRFISFALIKILIRKLWKSCASSNNS